jgi:rod shape determining protein RodA
MVIKEFIKKIDWTIFFCSLLLAGLGLMIVYSASAYRNDFLNFKKQLIFLFAGIILMIVFSLIDWRIFRDNRHLALFIYLLCLFGLVGLLFFAPRIGGSKSWYRFGQISVAPIEFTKLILVIILAKYFSQRHVELYQVRHILISGFYVFLPSLLILFEPEIGSVMVLGLLWIGVLVVSGIKLRHFLILSLCGLILAGLSWSFLFKDYQRTRIISFIFPSSAPLESGWNQAQAKIAIGSGGMFGKGFGNGTQIRYGFLPAAQTDFSFAGIVEEAGLLGAALVLSCFSLLVYRIVKISLTSQNNFSRLFATGIAIILVSQAIINIGMNLGLLPVVGIPLPLASYGGSSLVMTFLSLGILQNMKMNP